MKHLRWIILVGALVASCSPAATSTPTSVPPTEAVSAYTGPSPTQPAALAPAALAGLQAGSSMLWLDGAVLVYVPAGEFTMGSGIGNAPEKSVHLDGYWIYATVVTNKMYSQCVVTGNCAPPAQEVGSPVYSNSQYGDFPVVGVTWDMASNYCGWAQAQLPTEAQWEKAARDPTLGCFPGASPIRNAAWRILRAASDIRVACWISRMAEVPTARMIWRATCFSG